MLDVQHHESQPGKNILMQWMHGPFHLINSSEGLGSKDVDLDVPDRFEAFIGYLSAKIFRLLLIA
jgi:hypothetical protein